MHNLFASEDLAGLRAAAEACCQVERTAAIAAFRRQSFTRIQANADPQGQRRAARRATEPRLQVDRSTKSATGGDKAAYRLVASQLKQPPTPGRHRLSNSEREAMPAWD